MPFLDSVNALENTLAIFRQETPGAPWIRMTSLLSANVDEVETNIGGFTNYVIAY